MNVLIASSELNPLVKTGGLGDMVMAIANAVQKNGVTVRVLIPAYKCVLADIPDSATQLPLGSILGVETNLLLFKFRNIQVIALNAPVLFDRSGDPYRDINGIAWSDNWLRFGVLSKVAALIAGGLTSLPSADILHLNDWHTALASAYLHSKRIPTLLTVHNFSFQGRFSSDVITELEIEDSLVNCDDYFGGFSFLWLGLRNSQMINTVSKSYVNNIRKSSRFNHYFLPKKFDREILYVQNWVDEEYWSPEHDTELSKCYDFNSLDMRVKNRIHLEKIVGFQQDNDPLMCSMSRITKAKGFEFLERNLSLFLDHGFKLILIGQGEKRLLNRLRNAAARWPDKIALISPHSDSLARTALAGSDMLIMPSLTEPCGLSQQYAQRYGCLPIVSNAGGLIDTVEHCHTGFVFETSNSQSLNSSVTIALECWRDRELWRKMQRRAMTSVSYQTENQAHTYIDIYRSLKAASRKTWTCNGLYRSLES
jgi:starch synthase